jgi:geranyl-CoA carboxylase alpha subunit
VSEKDSEGGSNVFAPMHGNLIKVFAKNSQSIKKGDRLATLEAMKMQHELLAENDGIISSVHFLSGDQVRAGDLLFEIDLSGGE